VTVAGLDGETITQRHVLRHVAVSPARLKVRLSLGSWLRESVRQTGARHRVNSTGPTSTPGSRKLHRCSDQDVSGNKKAAHSARLLDGSEQQSLLLSIQYYCTTSGGVSQELFPVTY
jgi:hypothetical protein